MAAVDQLSPLVGVKLRRSGKVTQVRLPEVTQEPTAKVRGTRVRAGIVSPGGCCYTA